MTRRMSDPSPSDVSLPLTTIVDLSHLVAAATEKPPSDR
jgi:hypothetical protein